MILGGILTAIGLMIIVIKIDLNLTKLLLGYDWIVDIIMTIGIIILFATTGTISGLMIGVIAGLTISLSLTAGKRLYGYSKIEIENRRPRIKHYSNTWSLNTISDIWKKL
jgi:hypothetical protein